MRALCCFTLLCATLAAQEPIPLDVLPPDTVFIMGVRPNRVVASSAWKMLVSEIKKSNPLLPFDAAGSANLDEMIAVVPGRDLQSRMLVLARTDCKGAFASKLKIRQQTRKGITLSTACLPGGLVALGDAESLKAVRAGTRNAGPDRALMASAADLRGAYDVWLVTNADFGKLASLGSNPQAAAAMANSPIMKAIRQISMGLNLSSGVRFRLGIHTATPGDAEMFAGSMIMALGMLKSDPKRGPAVAGLVNRVKVHADGNAANVDLNVPESEYEAFASQLKAVAGPALAASNPGRITITGAEPEAGVMAPVNTPPPSASGGIVIHSSPKDMGTVELPPQ